GWQSRDIGTSLTVVGVASALAQGGVIRMAIPRLGERRAIIVGNVISAAGFIGFGLATRSWMMYAITFPFALGGLAGPSLRSMISQQVPATEQGQLHGSLSSLQSLTAVFGPLLGTALFAQFAPSTARIHIPGAPWFAAAAFHVVGIVLALRLFARVPEATSSPSSPA
ncbi:MAG: MFS transporter, partial [Deltaproteobacteria bacterium]